MYQKNILPQEGLNPTFLFCWKGLRTKDGESYHCHEFLEFCFIQSGGAKHRIDGNIYDTKEGDLLVFNAGTWHQALVDPAKGPELEFFVAMTDMQLCGYDKNCIPLKDGSPVIHTTGELKLKLNRLCLSLEAEKEQCQIGRYDMMKTYAEQMLLLLIREQEQPPKVSSPECCSFESVNRKYLVEKIMDYFEEHYAQKISLDRIAGNMYLSPFYISKIFKAETGNTPINYLIDIRMEKAKKLLEESPQLSVQEVSVRVGYEDAYHFSKLFKKKFGTTPSAVRKMH